MSSVAWWIGDLVVRAGKTTRHAALAARQRFSEDGTRMLGTILNCWDPKRSPNGYYGYHNGYSNGYYSAAKLLRIERFQQERWAKRRLRVPSLDSCPSGSQFHAIDEFFR